MPVFNFYLYLYIIQTPYNWAQTFNILIISIVNFFKKFLSCFESNSIIFVTKVFSSLHYDFNINLQLWSHISDFEFLGFIMIKIKTYMLKIFDFSKQPAA